LWAKIGALLNGHSTGSSNRPPEEPPSEAQASPQRRFPSWLRLYPFEIAAWLGLISGVSFLRLRGLRIGWETFNYTVPPLVPVLAKYFLIGIALYLVYTALHRESPLGYLRQIATVRWIVLSLRLWVAIIIFNYTYFWLKVCVPLVNETLWDEAFSRLDTRLHFGYSPSIVLIESVRGTLLGWIDRWYSLWLPSVSLSIAFFCAHPKALVRRQFVLSCVLIWILGAWIYVALPALGPVYVFTELWRDILPEMPASANAQQLLWENYQTIQRGIQDGQLYRFNPTRGIAAMPSLHVGVHWMLMLWMHRYARPLFIPAAIATFLTFLGSIITGWHYAIDGYVGIVLGQVAFWAALGIERRWGGTTSPGSQASPEGTSGLLEEGESPESNATGASHL